MHKDRRRVAGTFFRIHNGVGGFPKRRFAEAMDRSISRVSFRKGNDEHGTVKAVSSQIGSVSTPD